MEDLVVKYMVNKEWTKDTTASLKKELISITKKINEKSPLTEKYGAFMIHQQISEQILKEIIIASAAYIKAEIWPSQVNLKIDIDRKTFGDLIVFFDNYSIVVAGKKDLMLMLKKINDLRRDIVHKIFTIHDLSVIEEKINNGLIVSVDLLEALLNYYDEICWLFYDLNERVDFSEFA